ncbi:MAG: hypothetical protein PHY93_01245 [Bacteriovorax sp.]|nr:hypothetical protein [Bacteriovorax sp.]
MMDFLSDVFEFDVDCVSDSVQRGPLYLKLFELESDGTFNEAFNNNGVVFSFKVKSEEELKEIISKYNFFLYRKSNSNNIAEKLELIQNGTKKVLTISDIDQRLWRFEFKPSADV